MSLWDADLESVPWPTEIDSWEALSWHWKPTNIEEDNWEKAGRWDRGTTVNLVARRLAAAERLKI